MEKAKNFVETIVTNIVNLPDKVVVKGIIDDRGILIKVWVDKKDMGLLIGTNGSNANSLKNIVRMYGYAHDQNVLLQIEEPLNKYE